MWEEVILWGFFAFGVFGFFSTFVVDAPYGKFSETGFGNSLPKLNGNVGFMIQELPSLVVFSSIYIYSFSLLTLHERIGGFLFVCHYFHRSIIYTNFRGATLSPSAIHVVVLAFLVTFTNGYLQGVYLTRSTSTPIIQIIGFVMFWCGFWINYQSDGILIDLRKQKKEKYLIPYGGFFELVTCSNYFGEIVEWFGYALFCNNSASWVFLIFTMSNLVPRAIAQHKWYRTYFGSDYPKNRKAIIPFIL
jgi:protein-S-isoprenylcysteine O-methyltransferase Ste14